MIRELYGFQYRAMTVVGLSSPERRWGWDSSQVLRRQRVLRKACEFSSHIGEHSLSMLSRILCTAPEPLAFAGRGAVEP
jgi:hypothetical protein